MDTKVLYCKPYADDIKEACKNSIWLIKRRTGLVPSLYVIQVGDNPASNTYVRNKEKACEEVGIRHETIKLKGDITQEELIDGIKALNDDSKCNAILVQLPLPEHIDENLVLQSIDGKKDADGFTIHNAGLSALGLEGIDPCTPMGVMEILDAEGIDVAGKHAVVIGRSNIVGKPMARLLLDNNATVTVCHSKTQNLEEITKMADIIIVAVGRPKFFNNPNAVKEGVVIIDVGINRDENGKLCGDVDTEKFMGVASAITPVPKGVGVMTVAMLMVNTLMLFAEQNELPY